MHAQTARFALDFPEPWDILDNLRTN